MKKILYLQFTNPAVYPPLMHSSGLLLDVGWNVLFLGIASQGESGILAMPERNGCEVKLLVWVDPGVRQKIHYVRYMLWSLLTCLQQRPDAVYCSDPLAALPGFILRKAGYYVVYHEHDSPSAKERNGLPGLINWARKRLLQDASLVVFPNKQRAELVMDSVQSEAAAEVVWNCPGIGELPELQLRLVSPLVLYYHGNISGDLIPFAVLDALALLHGTVQLKAVGYETQGSLGYRQSLLDHAAELGIRHCVQIELPKSRSVLWEAAKGCHIGLSLMPKKSGNINMRYMTGASNKIFDYMACGMVSLVSDLRDWQEMFVAPGYAVACDPDDADSIAEQLQCLANNPIKREAMGGLARKKIEAEWNYEKQFEPVLRHLSNAPELGVSWSSR